MGRGSKLYLLAAFLAAGGCGGGSQPTNGLAGSVSRGSVDLRIDDAGGSNVSPSHIPANEVTVVFHDSTVNVVSLYAAGFQNEGGGSYAKRWDLTIDLVGEPVAGLVYQVGSSIMSSMPGTAAVLMQDRATWSSNGGTITVTSLANGTATFTFAGVVLAPADDSAMGTVTLDGTMTIDNIYAVCDCIG